MLKHFTKRSEAAIFVLVSIASACMICVSHLSAAARVGEPFPSFFVWRNLVVPAISAPSWPEHAGEIPFRTVLTVAGDRAVSDAADLEEVLQSTAPGSTIRYVFTRNGSATERFVPVAVLAWRDVLPTYLPYLGNGVVLIVAGLIVFYLQPRHPAARAFLILTFNLGAVLVLAIDLLASSWFALVYFALESLLPASLLLFAVSFPEERAAVRRRPGLRLLIFLPFLVLALLQMSNFASNPERHLRINDLVYGGMGVAGLVLVGSLIDTYVRSTNALARQQVLVVLLGMTLAALPASLALIAVVALGFEIPINLLSPAFAVGPLAIGYAIGRHDLFGIDRFLRTGVVYGALSLIVFVGYVAAIEVLRRVAGAEQMMPATLVPLYLLLLVVLFNPLYSRIQLFVDRLFHRQTYDYRDAVDRVSRALASFLDADRVATTTLATLTDTMSIERAAILLLPQESSRRIYARPAEDEKKWADAIGTDAATLRELSSSSGIRVCAPTAGQPTALFYQLGARLLAPVVFEGTPLGILLVGDKKSGGLYSDQDLHLIETLGNQTALAMKNAHAYEELRKTQRELAESERLAAVGELGAAVAHGIRNPLAGIRAAAQLAREEPQDAAGIAESLDDIVGEADRLEARIRSLLDFSRPFDVNVVRVHPRELLTRLADQVRRRIPESISFEITHDDRLVAVLCDPARTLEVLDELVTNALNAMGVEPGKLLVRSRLDSPEGDVASGVIEVVDSGPGFNREQGERIFALFFTTRPQGTGIGLATAKRLIERQGGKIEVSSAPGAGATFRLRFPAVSE